MDVMRLAKLVLTKDELLHIDYRLPEFFIEDCENLLNIDPRNYYVWSFIDNRDAGRPLNLAELYVDQFLGVCAFSGTFIDLNDKNELQRKILGQKRDM